MLYVDNFGDVKSVPCKGIHCIVRFLEHHMMLLAPAPNANKIVPSEVVTIKNIKQVTARIFPLLMSLLISLYLQAFHCEAHDPLKGTCTSVLECKACIKR